MICKKPFRAGTVTFGCGQCLPCRINKQRLWSHRIVLESFKHDNSSFITLTYSDEHLPEGGTLVPKDTQDWLKRLRSRFSETKFRYFLVGEYGDQFGRPHYHAALYGYPPCFDVTSSVNRRIQCKCETCRPILETWGKGRVSVDRLEPNSASYIAGYVTKKLTNKNDPKVKEHLGDRHPEFARMSLKPGIGAPAIEELARVIEEFGDCALDDGDVFKTLQHGKKKLPLGRYLTTKLRKEIGLEDQKEIQFKKFLEEKYEEGMLLQQQNPTKTQYEEALRKLKEKDQQVIKNIEKRFEIFKKNGDF